MKQRRIPAKAKAFTLIEAMVAITMIAMMSTVVMLGTGTVIDSADDALHRTIATGLAEQLMDEVMGTKYSEDISVPLLSTLSASISEQDGVDRSAYNDIDDFNFAGTGYAANGPVDPWGIAIGQGNGAGGLRNADFRVPTGFFDDWRQEIEVYYLRQNASGVWERTPSVNGIYTSSNQTLFRGVEVRILKQRLNGTWETLAQMSQVHAYVPPPS